MLVEKNDKLIITANPINTFACCLLCLILTLICCACLWCPDLNVYSTIYHTTIIFIGFLFFGAGFLFLLFRLLINRNLVIVDKNGITDNTNAIALGLIEWEDILDIRLNSVNDVGGDFITLILADEEKYLNRVSPMKKPMLLANIKMGFSIANISLSTTGVPIEEFYKKLIDYRNNL